MRYKLIKGGAVVNTILADEAFCASLVTAGECDAYEADPVIEVVQTAKLVSKLDFLKRFTAQERINIRTAASGGDAIAQDFIHLLDICDTVNLLDGDTIDGVQYCESKAYIVSGRSAEILA